MICLFYNQRCHHIFDSGDQEENSVTKTTSAINRCGKVNDTKTTKTMAFVYTSMHNII